MDRSQLSCQAKGHVYVVYGQKPPGGERFSILGATAGTLGLMEAVEAIKIITGLGQPLVGRILYVNLKDFSIEELRIERVDDCPVCGSPLET